MDAALTVTQDSGSSSEPRAAVPDNVNGIQHVVVISWKNAGFRISADLLCGLCGKQSYE